MPGRYTRHRQRAGTGQRRAIAIDHHRLRRRRSTSRCTSARSTETLVVSAAQIDQPLSRTPDSVTVIPGREIEAKQQFTLVVGAAIGARPDAAAERRPRHGDVALHARRRIGLHARAGRRHSRQLRSAAASTCRRCRCRMSSASKCVRGPQSALYGSDAIGGVIQVITRSGGKPSAQAQIETGSRDMRRAAGATTGEVNGVRWQLGANYFEDAGFTGTAANGETVSNDDAQETQASGSIGWRHATSGADLQGIDAVRRYRARIARPVSDRIRRTATPASTPSRAARPSASAAALRWMQPWFGASQPRPPARRVRRRRLRPHLQERSSATSDGNTHRSHARVQTDVVGERGVRILRRPRVARRARRQHVHHRRPGSARCPSSAACSASSARAAGTPAIARPSPPAFAASASRATRCPAIRSPSSRGPTFPKRRSTR